MAKPEYFDGVEWQTCCGDGADISVQNEPSTPIPITGSLTISAGSVNMTLGAELDALSAFSQNGLITRTGTGSYVGRSLVAGTGINITNGNGVLGNPVISATGLSLTLTGAVTGSGSGTINTTLGENQSLPFSYLKHNWSSGVEKGVYHILVDAATPPHFVHVVQSGSGSTYRRWLTVYKPGFGSQPTGSYQLGFYHAANGHQYPFEIGTYGSTLRTYLRTTVDINNNKIINLAEPSQSQDAATKNYVDNNAGGGSPYNGKFIFQESGYQIYIRAYSNYLDLRNDYIRNNRYAAIIETNSANETASIAMNGDYIQTIQTFDDLGFIFTDEDTDPTTSYQSYISSNGSLVTSSSKKKKHSIRKKSHKNYLERLNKLNIYSYALKTPIANKDGEKTKVRKFYKNKQLHVGLVSEEVNELFDNATDNYKTIDFDSKNKKEIEKAIGDYKPEISEQDYIKDKMAKRGDVTGIKYDTLLCYTILAIQELTQKVEQLEKRGWFMSDAQNLRNWASQIFGADVDLNSPRLAELKSAAENSLSELEDDKFTSSLIGGIGWSYFTYRDNKFCYEYIDPIEVLWDPDDRSARLDNSNFVCRVHYVPAVRLKNQYPEFAKEFEEMVEGNSTNPSDYTAYNTVSENPLWRQFAGGSNTVGNPQDDGSWVRGRSIKIAEIFYKKQVKYYETTVMFPEDFTGDTIPNEQLFTTFDESIAREKSTNGKIEIKNGTQIWHGIFCDNLLIENNPIAEQIPNQRYLPLTPVILKRDYQGMPYGVVDNLISPQKTHNFLWSTTLHYLDAKTIIASDEQANTDKLREFLKDEMRSKNGVAFIKNPREIQVLDH
ncbi:hypothetical protein AWC38_SpisGene23609 [Stylophora pistillata]|uniref:Peptidase S74 domain-containing protein n=1 Tax=Stylophora pistillata TaxID=50429 RepID=A0A2B4R255_STYPI|nr:hypothetical protein AWC38_SpisGene23609 [Stylophora pistillata]